MGSKTVFYTITTDKSLPEVKEAVRKSLMFLGGAMFEAGDGFQIKQGVNGVNFAFAANFETMVNIRQSAPNKYEIFANINWTPNTVFWVCLIVGIFIFGILWVVNLLYLFIDPSQAYQEALFRVQNLLN